MTRRGPRMRDVVADVLAFVCLAAFGAVLLFWLAVLAVAR